MIKIELEKIMSNIVFYLCIIATIILLLAGTLYSDSSTGEKYNLINFIIKKSNDVIKMADLHATDIIVSGVDGYLSMFAPIIVAVPFVMIVCGEKKNSNSRFEIYRIGKNKYFFGKFLASIIAGGLVVLIGYMIFSAIVYFVLPSGTGMLVQINYDYIRDETAFGKWYFDSLGVPGMIILKWIRMFFYGLVSAIPAFAISRIIKNRYIVISIPFMLFYLFEKIVVKHENKFLYRALITNIGNVFDTRYLSMVLIFGSSAVLMIVLCRFYLGRKCDCGEE